MSQSWVDGHRALCDWNLYPDQRDSFPDLCDLHCASADPLIDLIHMIEASVEPVEEIADALRTTRRHELLAAVGGTFIGYRCRNAVERECVGVHGQMRLDDDIAYAFRTEPSAVEDNGMGGVI